MKLRSEFIRKKPEYAPHRSLLRATSNLDDRIKAVNNLLEK
jgi:hypothetical protein